MLKIPRIYAILILFEERPVLRCVNLHVHKHFYFKQNEVTSR